MQIPFFNQLIKGKRFLIAGAGGSYDVVHGIPFYLYLTKTLNKQVTLANFSFTNLTKSQSNEVFNGTYQVTKDSAELDFFPERQLACWLWDSHSLSVPIYAFSYELGVQQLRKAYNHLIAEYDIDTILLIDGGTDSILFGDEECLGTITEEANSMVAVFKANAPNKYLLATGFGVDHIHGISHYNCLENIATLIKDDGFLGSFSLTKDMEEGKQYLALTKYLNTNNLKPSLTNHCIASALTGNFGDTQYSKKMLGCELFINPLMTFYWTFNLVNMVKHMEFSDLIEDTQSIQDVANKLQLHKIYKNGKYRYRQALPL